MRVAIVGIGAISPMHIMALQNNAENIVALCDIDIVKAQLANEKYGLQAVVYTDYLQMLDEMKPDVVHICTPHYLHASMICDALIRDVHVFCEKPVAISFQELEKIKDALKDSKAQLGVCQQNRYNASMQYVKEYLKDKPIVAASGTLMWKRDKEYYQSGKWRGKKSTEGGGVMINQALHTLDLLQWFCGMPKTVKAHVSNISLQEVIEVEDTAYGLFKLENGGNFMLFATNAANEEFVVRITLRTEEDTVDLIGDNIILNDKMLTLKDSLPSYGKIVWGVGHQLIISDFYDCLCTGKKFCLDFEEGQKAVRMILKMYESDGKELPV